MPRSRAAVIPSRSLGLTVLAAFAAATPAHAQAVDGGLRILLTNDDGYEAAGITRMRDALLAAGHSVTVVAPLENRSGSSLSTTTSGLIDYYEQTPGVWAIDGTPADAVSLALVHVMRATPPDLVVSGANFGQNVGASVLGSGTVGAALTASRAGIPAIAVSVAMDAGGRESTPPYGSTTLAFGPAAAFVVDLIGRLRESDAEGLLPARVVLNVNYPAVGAGEVAGVRFAPVASVRAFRQVYTVAGATGPARVETIVADAERAEADSDYDLLARDFVTISVLDGSLDAPQDAREGLIRRLGIER
jgi:5'/3'-nucleotidase SurE